MRYLNAIRTHAAGQDAQAPVARWGIVTSADPGSMTVKVTIQPEGIQTDWMPLLSSTVGNGWGLVHVPPVGSHVFLMPDAGDHNSYVVVGATWSNAARPPAGVKQGEVVLVHSTGSKISMTNDGKVTVADAGGCSLAFTNDGNAILTGNLNVSGSVIAGYGGADQVGLQTHRHTPGPGPTAGT